MLRRTTQLLCILALLIGLAGPLPAFSAPPPQWLAHHARTASRVSVVTTVTGDKAVVRFNAEGAAHVSVTPAPGRESIPVIHEVANGHRYLMPTDILRDVATGRIDRRRLDVGGSRVPATRTRAPRRLRTCLGLKDVRKSGLATATSMSRSEFSIGKVGWLPIRKSLWSVRARWTVWGKLKVFLNKVSLTFPRPMKTPTTTTQSSPRSERRGSLLCSCWACASLNRRR